METSARRIYSGVATRELNGRERRLLNGLVQGCRFKVIADELGIREGGARVLAHKVYVKLGADNRVQAVLFARDMGILADWCEQGETRNERVI